jgi:hypothetical protein
MAGRFKQSYRALNSRAPGGRLVERDGTVSAAYESAATKRHCAGTVAAGGDDSFTDSLVQQVVHCRGGRGCFLVVLQAYTQRLCAI